MSLLIQTTPCFFSDFQHVSYNNVWRLRFPSWREKFTNHAKSDQSSQTEMDFQKCDLNRISNHICCISYDFLPFTLAKSDLISIGYALKSDLDWQSERSLNDDTIFIFGWTSTLNTQELHDSGYVKNHIFLFTIGITIFPQFWIDS